MIKILALDLDGTFLNSAGKISEENKIAVRRAEENGVLVTIATGRRFRDALPIALEAEFNAPVICHNGALLKYAESLETVAFSLLENSTVGEILRVGKEFGGDALLSADPHGKGILYYDTVSDENIPLQKYLAWAQSLHGEDAENSVRHLENLADVAPHLETIHISFSGKCDRMDEMQKILQTELGKTVNILATVYTKLNFTLLDILPPDSSKGFGVERLAQMNGYSAENVMVIGDNFNDLEMLEYAGTPVIMGNAMPEMLACQEFHQTTSNDENGVAAAIERFILVD